MPQVPYDRKDADKYLGAGLIAYSSALTVALKAAAEVNGTEDMGWFDDIHAAAIKDAKGMITERMSVDLEAAVMAFGFSIVDATFKSIRKQILET